MINFTGNVLLLLKCRSTAIGASSDVGYHSSGRRLYDPHASRTGTTSTTLIVAANKSSRVQL